MPRVLRFCRPRVGRTRLGLAFVWIGRAIASGLVLWFALSAHTATAVAQVPSIDVTPGQTVTVPASSGWDALDLCGEGGSTGPSGSTYSIAPPNLASFANPDERTVLSASDRIVINVSPSAAPGAAIGASWTTFHDGCFSASGGVTLQVVAGRAPVQPSGSGDKPGDGGKGGGKKARPKQRPSKRDKDERIRYEVELKAWIPQAHIVDPIRPTPQTISRLPNALELIFGRVECRPAPTTPVLGTVTSTFRGDGHTRYDGSSRLFGSQRFTVVLDAKTKRVRRVEAGKLRRQVGTTHRDYEITDTLLGTGQRCTQSGTADPAKSIRGGFRGQRRWWTRLGAGNPLVLGAPRIDARLDGTVRDDGGLTIRYTADRMPNIAIRVRREGRPVATHIVNNVSCADLLGPGGAVDVAARLASATFGRFAIPRDGGGDRTAACP